jgi:SAM-dependent methyltransferase
MGKSKDAFGQQIYAYLKGKDALEIIERDDGYIDTSLNSKDLYFTYFKNWEKNEKEAIKFAKGKVLDIGCGAGRVELYLQKKGIDVLGIDNSPLSVKVCKLRGVKNVKNISITKINRLKPTKFRTVVMFGNNFGLFGNYKRSKYLLKELYKITSDDAIILAESRDPYKTNNPIHLAYHKLNKKQGRMGGELRMRVRFGTCIGNWFDYLLVSKSEMRSIIKGTGWEIKNFIDSKNDYIAIIKKSK